MVDSKSKDIEIISFEEVMDISIVTDLYKKLKKTLEMNIPITIEAENVERADTAILQVLYSFFQEASYRGIDISWRNPSEKLRLSARLIGVDDVLKLK